MLAASGPSRSTDGHALPFSVAVRPPGLRPYKGVHMSRSVAAAGWPVPGGIVGRVKRMIQWFIPKSPEPGEGKPYRPWPSPRPGRMIQECGAPVTDIDRLCGRGSPEVADRGRTKPGPCPETWWESGVPAATN